MQEMTMTPGDPKGLGALGVPAAPSTASTATATGRVFWLDVRTTALRVFLAFLPLRRREAGRARVSRRHTVDAHTQLAASLFGRG